jgi:hypothetical protein
LQALFKRNIFVCGGFRPFVLFAYGENNFCGGVRFVLTDCAKQVSG